MNNKPKGDATHRCEIDYSMTLDLLYKIRNQCDGADPRFSKIKAIIDDYEAAQPQRSEQPPPPAPPQRNKTTASQDYEAGENWLHEQSVKRQQELEREEQEAAAQPQRSEEPRFNLETLKGRKAAWAWLQDKFGNPLVVTKDGVPFEDQAEGVRQFKAAAQRREQEWTMREIRIDEDRNGWITGYGLFQGDQQLATGSKSELLRVADAINAALAVAYEAGKDKGREIKTLAKSMMKQHLAKNDERK